MPATVLIRPGIDIEAKPEMKETAGGVGLGLKSLSGSPSFGSSGVVAATSQD